MSDDRASRWFVWLPMTIAAWGALILAGPWGGAAAIAVLVVVALKSRRLRIEAIGLGSAITAVTGLIAFGIWAPIAVIVALFAVGLWRQRGLPASP